MVASKGGAFPYERGAPEVQICLDLLIYQHPYPAHGCNLNQEFLTLLSSVQVLGLGFRVQDVRFVHAGLLWTVGGGD